MFTQLEAPHARETPHVHGTLDTARGLQLETPCSWYPGHSYTLDTAAKDSSCSWYPGHMVLWTQLETPHVHGRTPHVHGTWTQLETPHVHGTLDTARDSSCSWHTQLETPHGHSLMFMIPWRGSSCSWYPGHS